MSVAIVLLLVMVGFYFSKPYTYTTKCPRCTGEAIVSVYGSADQYEYTKCSCGFEKEEII